MRKAVSLAVTNMMAAIEIVSPLIRTAAHGRTQFHFIAAIGAYQKSRQRMRKAYLRFLTRSNRLLPLLNPVPKLLRNNGLVSIVDDSPLCFVLSETLMIFIGKRCPT